MSKVFFKYLNEYSENIPTVHLDVITEAVAKMSKNGETKNGYEIMKQIQVIARERQKSELSELSLAWMACLGVGDRQYADVMDFIYLNKEAIRNFYYSNNENNFDSNCFYVNTRVSNV